MKYEIGIAKTAPAANAIGIRCAAFPARSGVARTAVTRMPPKVVPSMIQMSEATLSISSSMALAIVVGFERRHLRVVNIGRSWRRFLMAIKRVCGVWLRAFRRRGARDSS